MGNGPESSGDGAKFCGRGYIQLTGKDNYTAFGKSINEDLTKDPTSVADKYALLSAAWFFNKNGLHKMADEGAKFCGRGYIQLTGKDNYTAFGKSINEDLTKDPTSVADKYALLSAAWFFNKNGLHKMADEGATDAVVTKITKRVNGGTIGLADRIKHFKEYHHLLA
jgi:putative chitinase